MVSSRICKDKKARLAEGCLELISEQLCTEHSQWQIQPSRQAEVFPGFPKIDDEDTWIIKMNGWRYKTK